MAKIFKGHSAHPKKELKVEEKNVALENPTLLSSEWGTKKFFAPASYDSLEV